MVCLLKIISSPPPPSSKKKEKNITDIARSTNTFTHVVPTHRYGLAPDVRATVWYHATGGFALQEASEKTYAELVVLAREKYTQAERDQVGDGQFKKGHSTMRSSSSMSLLARLIAQVTRFRQCT